MKQSNKTITIATNGQSFYEITFEVSNWVKKQDIKNGLLTIFIQHTSCSLIIQENADSDVQKDLLNFLES